ncbi:MAG: hypothetical protein WD273_10325 [Trueperaceae bacterium]
MPELKLSVEDKETALLDLLGGWLEMVESCVDAGNLPREEFDREIFGDIVPETHEEWREHYTGDYLARVDQLYNRAAKQVLGDEDEAPVLTAAEFLRAYVLPLFEELEEETEGS